MKKLMLLVFIPIVLISCSKSSVNPTADNTTPNNDIYTLTKVNNNGSPILTLTYSNNRIATAQNTYYKDVFSYKSNGQIDTIVTYSFGRPEVYRIKRVTYGANGKIQAVICYSGKSVSESTTYTYDNNNFVRKIIIVQGAVKYDITPTFNSQATKQLTKNFTFGAILFNRQQS